MKKYFGILVAIIAIKGQSQVITPGNFSDDYVKMLYLKNYSENTPIGIFPASTYLYAIEDSIQWNIWGDNFRIDNYGDKKSSLSPINSLNSLNPYIPWSYNDGPIWRGKGVSTAITAGINVVSDKFIIRFNPILSFSQNNFFRIPDVSGNKSEFSYPLASKLDYVQRYGDGSYTNFHWGQSEARVLVKNFTLGLSTQNITWGPSQRNPIIMSKNAGGFPHIDLGTFKPVSTKIGSIEGKGYWGILNESDYFDEIEDNNQRYFGGLVLGYRPSFLPSLSIGVSRSLYRNLDGADLSDLFVQFHTFNPNRKEEIRPGFFSNDFFDQMMSLYGSWTFKDQGFEWYFEFAKNDFPGNFLEFVRYPDRARAYTMGFTKLVDIKRGDYVLKLNYEGTVLGRNQVSQVTGGGNPPFYIHHIVEQGYTHNGQLLGAGIGPGSNSNFFGANLYMPNGLIGLEVQRIRFNDDHLISQFGGQNPAPVEYEINYSFHLVKHWNQFSFQLMAAYLRHQNLYTDDDRGGTFGNAQLNIQYRFE